MSTIIIISSFVVVYILSILINYRFIRICYSNKGKTKGENVNVGDVIMTFMPIINILSLLTIIFESPYSFDPEPKNYNRIFNINKS